MEKRRSHGVASPLGRLCLDVPTYIYGGPTVLREVKTDIRQNYAYVRRCQRIEQKMTIVRFVVLHFLVHMLYFRVAMGLAVWERPRSVCDGLAGRVGPGRGVPPVRHHAGHGGRPRGQRHGLRRPDRRPPLQSQEPRRLPHSESSNSKRENCHRGNG